MATLTPTSRPSFAPHRPAPAGGLALSFVGPLASRLAAWLPGVSPRALAGPAATVLLSLLLAVAATGYANHVPLPRRAVLQAVCVVCLLGAAPVGAVLVLRTRAERRLRQVLAAQQVLLAHTQDAIVLSSIDGSQRYVSPAIERLAGWTPREYLALDRFSTLHPDDRAGVEAAIAPLFRGESRDLRLRYRLRHRDGGFSWVEAAVRAYGDDGRADGYVGTLRDLSAEMERELSWQQERARLTAEGSRLAAEGSRLAAERQHLVQLAGTDPLTGLLNRRGLAEALAAAPLRGHAGAAVLALDIDYFKQFNDAHGHIVGDDCLLQVARVLRSRVGRTGDLLARVGGEEFCVVLPGAGLGGGHAVADAIQAALGAAALPHAGSPHGLVTISIGVSARDGAVDATTLRALEAEADAALYASKRHGRNRVTVWEPSMTS